MARVKRGTIAHKRRQHLLRHTKGFRWGRKTKFRMANEAMLKAWTYQFRDRDLVRHIDDILRRTGLPADRLELEITESAMMENSEQTAEVLRSIGSLGIHLAIDDFGTGFSSLAYLKRFPLDRLKIDRSFIMDLEQDTNDLAITEGIIMLARSLGLAVIAEGIETPTQLDILKNFGCGEGQGYLFGRPMLAEELGNFLRRRALYQKIGRNTTI